MKHCLSHIPCTELPGVGSKVAEKLAKLGIVSIQDVLFHLPRSYQDRTTVIPINRIEPGKYMLVEGSVLSANVVYGRRMSLVVNFSDSKGVITLRFFHFNRVMRSQLSQVGQRLRCFGEVRFGPRGLEMAHPEYQLIDDKAPEPLSASLTPIYPVTEGLGQAGLRRLIGSALSGYAEKGVLQECLPQQVREHCHFDGLAEALLFVHHPSADADTQALLSGDHPAVQRLAFEELLAHQLVMIKSRLQLRQRKALALLGEGGLRQRLIGRLGFVLTTAQERVINDIDQDLMQESPMLRLLQGDVGCGKTVVAAMAMCRALASNRQAALMAPTEVLAEQHAKIFSEWFVALGVGVVLLTGKMSVKARRAALNQMATEERLVIIGTHALFQEDVHFASLSMIVIDEQHRFGVGQRHALMQKGEKCGEVPHQLIMTATPIPRTLAMTAYADLETSVIDELPPGRTPIQTIALPDTRRDEIVNKVRNACINDGRQAYWVCTLIDDSEVLEAQAASDTAEALRLQLPELNIGLVHGRMKSKEKQQIMQEFKEGKLHLLVATTVIEVGVDVPNSSLMIIENPERLGLAQLHQLRGRVGRGSVASHCVLLYHSPLSKTAQKRLSVLRESNDGFVIAQRDLEIRGPGELLGTKQTGLADFKIADLVRDQHLIPEVQRIARHLHDSYPKNAKAIILRWLGERDIYSNA
mgnify:CR=1 FL=1